MNAPATTLPALKWVRLLKFLSWGTGTLAVVAVIAAAVASWIGSFGPAAILLGIFVTVVSIALAAWKLATKPTSSRKKIAAIGAMGAGALAVTQSANAVFSNFVYLSSAP